MTYILLSSFTLSLCILLVYSATVPSGNLRLVRSYYFHNFGRLEIYLRGEWGTVCINGWNFVNSYVACRQLGFSRSVTPYYATHRYNSGTGRIWLDNVNCQGNESHLVNCSNNGIGVQDCTHSQDVTIYCRNTFTSAQWGSLRLVRGSVTDSESFYTSGRLEIYLIGEWGTVCNYGWNSVNSDVACRQLGFSGAARPTSYGRSTSARFGSGTGRTWLHNVNCQGSESRLISCSNNGIIVDNCTHSQDVAIYCEAPHGNLRLVRGLITKSFYTSGRLEINLREEWGTVCDDGWKSVNSDVACRQLGFSGAARPTSYGRSTSARFGSGTGPTWLDSVNCQGNESRLISCSNNANGVRDCAHYQDIAIYCANNQTSSASQGDLRLVQGAVTVSGLITSSGRLEIYTNGSWGTVCSVNDTNVNSNGVNNNGVNNNGVNRWGLTESNVACRQLGYRRATGYGQAISSGFGSGNGEIWLDNVNCSSNETKLLSCSHNHVLGVTMCSHAEDVSVYCTNILENGPLAGAVIGSAAGALCLFVTCGVNIHYVRKKRQRHTAAPTNLPASPTTTTTTVTTDHPPDSSQPKASLHYQPGDPQMQATTNVKTNPQAPGLQQPLVTHHFTRDPKLGDSQSTPYSSQGY